MNKKKKVFFYSIVAGVIIGLVGACIFGVVFYVFKINIEELDYWKQFVIYGGIGGGAGFCVFLFTNYLLKKVKQKAEKAKTE
jgi:uncharacterized membrane protein YedE/YeeE